MKWRGRKPRHHSDERILGSRSGAANPLLQAANYAVRVIDQGDDWRKCHHHAVAKAIQPLGAAKAPYFVHFDDVPSADALSGGAHGSFLQGRQIAHSNLLIGPPNQIVY